MRNRRMLPWTWKMNGAGLGRARGGGSVDFVRRETRLVSSGSLGKAVCEKKRRASGRKRVRRGWSAGRSVSSTRAMESEGWGVVGEGAKSVMGGLWTTEMPVKGVLGREKKRYSPMPSANEKEQISDASRLSGIGGSTNKG